MLKQLQNSSLMKWIPSSSRCPYIVLSIMQIHESVYFLVTRLGCVCTLRSTLLGHAYAHPSQPSWLVKKFMYEHWLISSSTPSHKNTTVGRMMFCSHTLHKPVAQSHVEKSISKQVLSTYAYQKKKSLWIAACLYSCSACKFRRIVFTFSINILHDCRINLNLTLH
jgi:hypothetical protein